MGSELMLIGIIGGILGGLLGVGGGTIYVPFLVLLFGLSQQLAQGISLTVMIPMSLLGGYSYLRRGQVRKDLILELITGSIIGAFLGATVATVLPADILRKLFSVMLAVVGLRMLGEKK